MQKYNQTALGTPPRLSVPRGHGGGFQGVLKVTFSAKYGGDPFVLFTLLLDVLRCTIAPLVIDTVVQAHEPKILERLFNAARVGDVPVMKESAGDDQNVVWVISRIFFVSSSFSFCSRTRFAMGGL